MNFSKRLLLKNGKFQKEKEYWEKKLSGGIYPSTLPADRKYAGGLKPSTETINFSIPNSVLTKMDRISNGSEMGIFLLVTSSMNAVLSQYSNEEVIVIGTPVFKHEYETGDFINDRLAIINHLNEEMTWKEFLLQVQQTIKEANEHQNFPYEELVNVADTAYHKDSSVFKTFLMFEHLHSTIRHDLENQHLILSFQRSDGELRSRIQYRSDLYHEETIKRFFQQIILALESFCENANEKVSDSALITEEEENQILEKFNQKSETTYHDIQPQTLHQLFEQSVVHYSEKTALVFKNEKVSYQDLNHKSNQLSRKLLDLGVNQQDYVGIMIDNSIEMVIGILAILKAGAAYVPLDPLYPANRIDFMLKDSNIRILLTSSRLEQAYNALDYSHEVVCVDDPSMYAGEGTNLHLADSEAPAYVIYTSGSTGKPKGVSIDHQAVVHYVEQFIQEFQLNKSDGFLLHSSFAFDASIEQLFPILLVGGKLVIPEKDIVMDIPRLATLIETEGVSMVSSTPLILNEFNKQRPLSGVRTFIGGGDVLKKEHISNLVTYSTVYNTYGPTEATVCATFHKVDPEVNGKILIGRPIPDKSVYILNKKGKLVPIGVPGEIYLSGKGLSKGYLNRPEITKESFVDDPFKPGQKMYKTGDVGRWHQDGSIEFIGRIGNQVNIRGYRVELEEIEKTLLHHPEIREAVVINSVNSVGNEVLCAYYIANHHQSPILLENHLREHLPPYMIPTDFIELDLFPSTVNGKLDYSALPKPKTVRNSVEGMKKPSNSIEKRLLTIWSEVLGIEEEVINIEDDFFKLGGHSLKATILIAHIYKELKVEIPIREFFQEPTIISLAQYIQTVRKRKYEPIEPLKQQEYYPVSAAQKRLLTIAKLDESSSNYNISGAFMIEGLLDQKRFEQAFHSLVKRHESLRTSFQYADFEAKQVVHEKVDFQIHRIKASEEELAHVIPTFVIPFDLEKAPLFRVKLVEIHERKHLFFIDLHHNIADGYSIDVLIKEFAEIYEGRELLEPLVHYKDYASWQNQFLSSEALQQQETYWLNRLQGDIPVLQLPTDYPRPSVLTHKGDMVTVQIEHSLLRDLQRMAAEKGMTLYMVLLAAYNVLLSKYCNQEDTIVGTPISGRNHPDVGNMVGMFVNTLVLRNFPENEKPFIQFLDEVKQSTLAAFENQDYPFELLVNKLNVERDTSRNPIFDTVFTFQDVSYAQLKIDDLRVSQWEVKPQASKFDLSLYMTQTENGLEAQFEYMTELFSRDSIQRLSRHFVHILEVITSSPEITIADITMTGHEEESGLLHDFNQTQYDFDNHLLMHEIFEKHAEKTPNKIALQFAGGTMTYQELNQQANGLANKLRKQGVKAEVLVGCAMERSFEMVKSILAILKAGGAYVPVDPHHPSNRIENIILDSQPCMLLTQSKFKERFSSYHENILVVDDKMDPQEDVTNLDRVSTLENLAYVIYTSGSTGKPKGVMIEHRNIVNTLFGLQRRFLFTEEDAYLLKAPFVFDASVAELFGWMIAGGRLVILEPELEKDPMAIYWTIQKDRATHVNFVPSMFQAFIEMIPEDMLQELTNIKYIFLGGEAVTSKLAKKAMKLMPKTKIMNLYGPTEACIYTTGYSLDHSLESSIVPIGKPLDNVEVFVLNDARQLQPIGIPGELCIAGKGVARGYLYDEKKTNEKFIPHPFKQDGVLYKTGDLVRWLPDGNIEYLGRKDFQIKIRGYRVEIGEIQYIIMQREGVREAVIIGREDAYGRKYICAYIVADREYSHKEWHHYLIDKLPEYMIPTHFAHLDSMPLSPNGKLDRKALPEVETTSLIEDYVVPRSETEEQLVEIWSEVLGMDSHQIGITQNFFESGGHSLNAITLVTKLNKTFHKEISLRDIFKLPTIELLSVHLENSKELLHKHIPRAGKREYYPLSNVQKRLFILEQTRQLGISYNMPVLLEIQGALDRNKLEMVLHELIQRHEAFRTSFDFINGVFVQKIHEVIPFVLEYETINELEIDENIEKFITPFDLTKAPLIRAKLFEVNQSKFIFCLDAHHIIADGSSLQLLLNEIIVLYRGEQLPELSLQYKDYAVWQQSEEFKEVLEKQEMYWRDLYKEDIKLERIPFDYPESDPALGGRKVLHYALNQEVSQQLVNLAKEDNTTLYQLFFTVYSILVSKYSGSDDVIIGTPTAGRTHADVEKIVGMFVNTLAIRNQPKPELTFNDFLSQVKENTILAFENQDYPYEMLLDTLQFSNMANAQGIIHTMFIYKEDKLHNHYSEIDGMRLTEYPYENGKAKFDLTINVVEKGNQFYLDIVYQNHLYKIDTISQLAEDMELIAEQVAQDGNIKIGDIRVERKILSEEITFPDELTFSF
ncbi:non-ribosomal peptide synthetase [Metabacillus malikii]|uniref:Amino acid adenylation domain-containing protein n=1 Tax=Metabacillus malikii TaxID=1504265 RepID=A0ABT9ZKP6_9BACI|nr:non-ribosomal peptide synthetase [Metabacillus malikii]MDQ0232872.1 amino acid adenylation domain-containing protein [Metabacillus malikii]